MSRNLAVVLDDDDDRTLDGLTTEGSVTRTSWVRGAIRAADVDAEVAQAILAAAPDDTRGGTREGAGRPSKS